MLASSETLILTEAAEVEATPEEWEHGSSDIVYVLSRLVMSDSLEPHGLQPARLICPWGVSRQEYWSGLPCPPPGIFLIQGSNPGFLHCRWILFYQLSHQGSPRILQWVAYPFSRDLPDPGIKLGSPALQAILYQLSYQGRFPASTVPCLNPDGNQLVRSPAHRAHSHHFLNHKEEQK